MISKITTAFLLVLLISSCSNRYTCEDFKTGTYRFAEKELQHVTITRTLEEQIEESTESENPYRDVYEIVWDGSCSYQLIFKSTNNISRMPFSKYDTISSSIIEIVDDGYIFETAIFEKRPQGHLIKVD